MNTNPIFVLTIKKNNMSNSINTTSLFSNRNENTKITGEFYVTYSAERFGKKYTTTHLNPLGRLHYSISADELNEQLKSKYKGLCPFNGDANFEVIKIQKRTQF
jgi:hypothetical protein